jgi:hypothetical protein
MPQQQVTNDMDDEPPGFPPKGVHADTKIGKDAPPARGRKAPPTPLKWPEQLSHLDLSDAVRNDIHFEVDYHFYMSLKTSFCMSLTAFVKGILLPLVESPMPASAPSERAIIIAL